MEYLSWLSGGTFLSSETFCNSLCVGLACYYLITVNITVCVCTDPRPFHYHMAIKHTVGFTMIGCLK